MRKSVKRALGAGILGGAAYAAWRAWSARVPRPAPGGIEWSTAPFPFPPVPNAKASAKVSATANAKPGAPKAAAKAWKEPKADGSCPKGYPIKAKMASGIFHAPGGANYARTKPDRCYVDAAAATADGLRPARA